MTKESERLASELIRKFVFDEVNPEVYRPLFYGDSGSIHTQTTHFVKMIANALDAHALKVAEKVREYDVVWLRLKGHLVASINLKAVNNLKKIVEEM